MKLNPYLNFMGQTEEAFNFYKSVFGGEFLQIQRFRDVEDLPGKEEMSEEDLNKIMHVSLPIGENVLMGTDTLESMGHSLTLGNNLSISVNEIESKEEADRIFSALLADGGKSELEMQQMFWGDYFGMVDDKYGVKWMITHTPISSE